MLETTFHCPGCGSLLRLSVPVDGDKKVKCPRCDYLFAARPGNSLPSTLPGAAPETPLGAGRDYGPMNRPEDPAAITRPELARQPASGGREGRPVSLEDRIRLRPVRKDERVNGNKILAYFVILALLIAAGGVAAYFIWFRDTLPAGTGTEDPLAYLPKETTFVLGLNWGDVKKASNLNDQQIDQVLPMVKAQLGNQAPGFPLGFLDLFFKHTDRLILAVTPEQEVIVVIRTGQAYRQKDMAKLLEATDPHPQKDDKVYYRLNLGPIAQVGAGNGSSVFLCMPNNRIIIVGLMPEKRAQELLNADEHKPKLAPDLLALSRKMQSGIFWLTVYMDRFGEPVLGQKRFAVPAELQPLLTQAKQLKGVGFSLNVAREVRVELDLMCPDPAKAKEVARTLQDLWDKKVKPQIAQAKLNGGERMVVTELTNSLRIIPEDKNVALSCQVSGHTLQMAAPDLQMRFFQWAMQMQQQGGGQPFGPFRQPRPAFPRR